MSRSKDIELNEKLQKIDPVFVKLVTGGFYGMLTNAGSARFVTLVQAIRPEYHVKTIQRHMQNPLVHIPKKKTEFFFELYADCLARVIQQEIENLNDLEYRKKSFKEIIEEYKQLKPQTNER